MGNKVSTEELNKQDDMTARSFSNHKRTELTVDSALSEKRVACLESFVGEVYKAKRSNYECLRSILLPNRNSRESFVKFIKVNGAVNDEKVQHALDRFQNMSDSSAKSTISTSYHIETLSYLDSVPSYVESADYSAWRARERALVYEMMVNPFSNSKAKIHPDQPSNSTKSAEKALHSISERDLEKVLSSSTWIPSLIASAATMPLSIMILHGSDNSIIYVNEMFTSTTNYDQEDIKGKDLRALRKIEGEDEFMNEVEMKFESRKLFCTKMKIHSNKKLETFCEIYFKPITDQYNICQYWIGLMESLDHKTSDRIDLKRLLLQLPNRVVMNV
jgi:PAS domain-containing protein